MLVTRPLLRSILCLALALAGCSAKADYTVKVNKAEDRGVWEGWGCSLCWWGKGVGNTPYQDKYADLLFTDKTISLLGPSAPGLGLNLVRYNVGGGGSGEMVGGEAERKPDGYPWYKDIEGFWIDPASPDPASSGWDWQRDANQRAVLKAAVGRGAKVEFFSNAPMWWMTAEKSSAGGKLLEAHRRDFARYLAAVVQHAETEWGVRVASLSPFNEPSAWWWNYPGKQEGCTIRPPVQEEILGYLREEMSARGLGKTVIAASDENTMYEARATYDAFKAKPATVNGRSGHISDLVGKVNVHAYYGLQPFRDNKARAALRETIGNKRCWMSEYGDGEGGGMPLAQTIVEDMTYLRPSAWIYWQPIEPWSGWGLVNARFGAEEDRENPRRAEPTWLYTKYFTFAQFTRFLRPGYRILGSDDPNSIVAYDARGKRLVLITVSYAIPQKITLDLGGLKRVGTTATLTVTNTGGPKRLQSSPLTVSSKQLGFEAEANSVYSVLVDGVVL